MPMPPSTAEANRLSRIVMPKFGLMEPIAAAYRRERLLALGLAAVDSMVQNGPEEIDEGDPRLVAEAWGGA